MKKLAQYLAMIVLVIMVLSTMVSCSTQKEEYHVKNPTAAPSFVTIDPDWTPMPQPTDAAGEMIAGNPYDYLNPERIFNPGEWMDIAGMEFRFNGVEFTKCGEGIDLERLHILSPIYSRYGMLVDEAGNLYGNCSYTILDYTIKNATGQEMTLNLYNIGLEVFQANEHYLATTGVHYVTPAQNDDYVYIFQPGEEVDFKSIHVLEDYFQDNENIFFLADHVIVHTVPDSQPYAWYFYDGYVPINKDKSEVDVYATYQDKRDFVNPERLYNMSETAEIKGMTFRVNDVTMQKELEGISMDRIRYPDYEKKIISSDGTFQTGEYSRVYVRANVTIKNLTEQPMKICTSAIYLSTPHSDGITSQGAAGVTPSITTNLKYDDFYNFQPGEEVTFDIYYIEHDRCLTDDTLMIHFPLNMGLQDAENPESSYDYDVFVPIKKDKSEVDVYA